MEQDNKLAKNALMKCPNCEIEAKIKEQNNLLGEKVKVIVCPNGCSYSSNDGIHWNPLIVANKEGEIGSNDSNTDL